MLTTPKPTRELLSRLQTLIDANGAIVWRTFTLAEPSQLQALQWQNRAEEQHDLVPLLRAYQRLLHILPASEECRVWPLLESGLHSAIQIASLSREEFASRWAALFPDDAALGEAVRQNAIGRRSTLLLHHINRVQHNEPHYRAARFK